jgi:putative ABC transport system permease protein
MKPCKVQNPGNTLIAKNFYVYCSRRSTTKLIFVQAFPMVSLARKNLLEDIPRFLVAQAGIMFAVTLVTLQTGIFNGFTRSTGQLIHNSEADIWVASESLVQVELTLPIPLSTSFRLER